jgi:HAD superfamily hydrolase (TIGR01509 family)
MAHIGGVILDVDGTLIDSNDQHALAWVEAMAEAGYKVPVEKVRRLIGMGSDNLLPAALGLDKENQPGKQISERQQEIFKEKYLATVKPFPKARDLLQRMREQGLKLVVASSAQADELNHLLEIVGANDLVEEKTSSSEAKNSKPDPDIIKVALDKLKFPADRVVMLGDTPYDIKAASKLRVAVIALRAGGWSDEELKGARAIYDNPADLLTKYDTSLLGKHH